MTTTDRTHRLRRMTGRDPAQPHRAATPLELLFDLTFVAAFAVASNEAAHFYVEDGQVGTTLGAFAFVAFAVTWAWLNYSWFASAFDTDDWFFRTMTMVQMAGVVVLALSAAPVFESLGHGETLDNGAAVAGYIVMRLSMLGLWIRVAIQSPRYRRVAVGYIVTITISQIGWTLVALMGLPLAAVLPVLVLLYAIEFTGPAIAERIGDTPPWHPHHIAERFGLLLIITLGEVIAGTVAAVAALVGRVGWSLEAGAVVLAGVGLAFGLWWSYFITPAGDVLARHRDRSWVWNYLHILLYGAIAATGVGLHIAAYVVEGEDHDVGVVGAVVAVAVPVAVSLVVYFATYSFLVRTFDPFHLWIFVAAAALLAVAVLLAATGASLALCLVLVMFAPAVIVVGYETIGHRHMAAVLDRILA